jgi:hypothetical protein
VLIQKKTVVNIAAFKPFSTVLSKLISIGLVAFICHPSINKNNKVLIIHNKKEAM